MKTLLLEIGTEEIPAGYIAPALAALESMLVQKLADARIAHGSHAIGPIDESARHPYIAADSWRPAPTLPPPIALPAPLATSGVPVAEAQRTRCWRSATLAGTATAAGTIR